MGTFLQYHQPSLPEDETLPQPNGFSHEPVPVHGRLRTGGFDLPGPVNIVALGSGARHGLRASLAHVAGATLGFCLLLVLVGLGLHQLLLRWPLLGLLLHWGGVAFLLYMAWKLAADDGQLGAAIRSRPLRRGTARRCNGSTPRPGWQRWPGWVPTPAVSSSCCGCSPGSMGRSASFQWPAGRGQAA